ncbi:unnamed protein product [Amoebophrya sp. A120]|nr:unnamed protein product [Amoebophrya sp. A120]|eukprot:GSA120T00014579001.1
MSLLSSKSKMKTMNKAKSGRLLLPGFLFPLSAVVPGCFYFSLAPQNAHAMRVRRAGEVNDVEPDLGRGPGEDGGLSHGSGRAVEKEGRVPTSALENRPETSGPTAGPVVAPSQPAAKRRVKYGNLRGTAARRAAEEQPVATAADCAEGSENYGTPACTHAAVPGGEVDDHQPSHSWLGKNLFPAEPGFSFPWSLLGYATPKKEEDQIKKPQGQDVPGAAATATIKPSNETRITAAVDDIMGRPKEARAAKQSASSSIHPPEQTTNPTTRWEPASFARVRMEHNQQQGTSGNEDQESSSTSLLVANHATVGHQSDGRLKEKASSPTSTEKTQVQPSLSFSQPSAPAQQKQLPGGAQTASDALSPALLPISVTNSSRNEASQSRKNAEQQEMSFVQQRYHNFFPTAEQARRRGPGGSITPASTATAISEVRDAPARGQHPELLSNSDLTSRLLANSTELSFLQHASKSSQDEKSDPVAKTKLWHAQVVYRVTQELWIACQVAPETMRYLLENAHVGAHDHLSCDLHSPADEQELRGGPQKRGAATAGSCSPCDGEISAREWVGKFVHPALSEDAGSRAEENNHHTVRPLWSNVDVAAMGRTEGSADEGDKESLILYEGEPGGKGTVGEVWTEFHSTKRAAEEAGSALTSNLLNNKVFGDDEYEQVLKVVECAENDVKCMKEVAWTEILLNLLLSHGRTDVQDCVARVPRVFVSYVFARTDEDELDFAEPGRLRFLFFVERVKVVLAPGFEGTTQQDSEHLRKNADHYVSQLHFCLERFAAAGIILNDLKPRNMGFEIIQKTKNEAEGHQPEGQTASPAWKPHQPRQFDFDLASIVNMDADARRNNAAMVVVLGNPVVSGPNSKTECETPGSDQLLREGQCSVNFDSTPGFLSPARSDEKCKRLDSVRRLSRKPALTQPPARYTPKSDLFAASQTIMQHLQPARGPGGPLLSLVSPGRTLAGNHLPVNELDARGEKIPEICFKAKEMKGGVFTEEELHDRAQEVFSFLKDQGEEDGLHLRDESKMLVAQHIRLGLKPELDSHTSLESRVSAEPSTGLRRMVANFVVDKLRAACEEAPQTMGNLLVNGPPPCESEKVQFELWVENFVIPATSEDTGAVSEGNNRHTVHLSSEAVAAMGRQEGRPDKDQAGYTISYQGAPGGRGLNGKVWTEFLSHKTSVSTAFTTSSLSLSSTNIKNKVFGDDKYEQVLKVVECRDSDAACVKKVAESEILLNLLLSHGRTDVQDCVARVPRVFVSSSPDPIARFLFFVERVEIISPKLGNEGPAGAEDGDGIWWRHHLSDVAGYVQRAHGCFEHFAAGGIVLNDVSPSSVGLEAETQTEGGEGSDSGSDFKSNSKPRFLINFDAASIVNARDHSGQAGEVGAVLLGLPVFKSREDCVAPLQLLSSVGPSGGSQCLDFDKLPAVGLYQSPALAEEDCRQRAAVFWRAGQPFTAFPSRYSPKSDLFALSLTIVEQLRGPTPRPVASRFSGDAGLDTARAWLFLHCPSAADSVFTRAELDNHAKEVENHFRAVSQGAGPLSLKQVPGKFGRSFEPVPRGWVRLIAQHIRLGLEPERDSYTLLPDESSAALESRRPPLDGAGSRRP